MSSTREYERVSMDQFEAGGGGKTVAAAAEGNKRRIARALGSVLEARCGAGPLQLLEFASGTGQHAAHIASALPRLTVTPSEANPAFLPSISAYVSESGLPNLRPPLLIDVSQPCCIWPPLPSPPHCLLCINMVHICPWEAVQGLFAGAQHLLSPGGVLVTYGPYAVDGVLASEGNRCFHAGLQERDSRWGLRDTRELRREAGLCGLDLAETIPMPNSNHLLVFVRRA